MARKPKFYDIAKREEDAIISKIDLADELAPFIDQIDEAIELAKQGKLKKLRSVASTIETVRILTSFKQAIETKDIRKIEYYGGLIRDYMMDKPKVALEHTAGEGMKGVVILPEAKEGA